MFSFFLKGGVMMYFIITASVVALTIIMERIVYFYRIRINAQDFLLKIKNILGQNPSSDDVEAALAQTNSVRSPLGAILSTIIKSRHKKKSEIEQDVEIASKKEIPKMELFLSGLNTIGAIAPLMGLLGTVIGMISSFKNLGALQSADSAGGAASSSAVAQGISSALYTTAAGLFVALPVVITYNYFNRKVEMMINDMEQCGSELISYLKDDDIL